MERKKGEAATKIKEAYRLWKAKNKKKKKKKKWLFVFCLDLVYCIDKLMNWLG